MNEIEVNEGFVGVAWGIFMIAFRKKFRPWIAKTYDGSELPAGYFYFVYLAVAAIIIIIGAAHAILAMQG